MPWKECSAVSEREEFVRLAKQAGANLSDLCRRFGVSRKSAYKWIRRFDAGGVAALVDRSRRPHASPRKTDPAIEQEVLGVRKENPVWGGRKIHHTLAPLHAERAITTPSPSTITAILRRNNAPLDDPASHKPMTRFEHPHPNDLWQMDFKGHFATGDGRRCHPLTILDDHSRFNLALRACTDEQSQTVQHELTLVFRHYGLPTRMLMDNGSPWGNAAGHRYTPLTVWLLQLGVRVSHGRPYHPQTQGKEERFHRTLKAELLRGNRFEDAADSQRAFDPWRDRYNNRRPHEALGMGVPADRYCVSKRPMPSALPPIEYDPDDAVRKVQQAGRVNWHGRLWRVPHAFTGHAVGVRATTTDGVWEVRFGHHLIGTLDERGPGPAVVPPANPHRDQNVAAEEQVS